FLGHDPDVTLDADTDHGLTGEAELEGIGDGNDLHDAGLTQSLDASPHGSLRKTDGLGDRPVWLPPVTLQGLDDRPVGWVEERCASDSPLTLCHARLRRLVRFGHANPHSMAQSKVVATPRLCRILSQLQYHSSR